MHFQTELSAALDAASRAASAVMERYASFQAIANAPAEITTEADRISQELIVEHLRRRFPDDAFCAEEATAGMDKLPRTGDRLWVVDPIDGTRGFARKNGEFSIMVGFVHAGQVAVGVVSEPAKDRLTYATAEGGCYRKDGPDGKPEKCRVSTTTNLASACLTQSRSHHDESPSRELRALAPARILESYSAGIKLALVARGDADLYLNTYTRFHDWDICAGHILVAEAGGQVSGLQGETLRYGLPGALQDRGLLATNGRLHSAALAALEKR